MAMPETFTPGQLIVYTGGDKRADGILAASRNWTFDHYAEDGRVVLRELPQDAFVADLFKVQ
jgi:hypothetical protein